MEEIWIKLNQMLKYTEKEQSKTYKMMKEKNNVVQIREQANKLNDALDVMMKNTKQFKEEDKIVNKKL
jgi:hypothetical protein